MKIKWYKVFESKEELEVLCSTSHTAVHATYHGEFLFVRQKDNFLAFKNKCPHQNKKLDGCWIKNNHIVCPMHQYSFSLTDGKGHGLCLDKYPIEYRTDGVFIGIEKFSIF